MAQRVRGGPWAVSLATFLVALGLAGMAVVQVRQAAALGGRQERERERLRAALERVLAEADSVVVGPEGDQLVLRGRGGVARLYGTAATRWSEPASGMDLDGDGVLGRVFEPLVLRLRREGPPTVDGALDAPLVVRDLAGGPLLERGPEGRLFLRGWLVDRQGEVPRLVPLELDLHPMP